MHFWAVQFVNNANMYTLLIRLKYLITHIVPLFLSLMQMPQHFRFTVCNLKKRSHMNKEHLYLFTDLRNMVYNLEFTKRRWWHWSRNYLKSWRSLKTLVSISFRSFKMLNSKNSFKKVTKLGVVVIDSVNV